MTYNYYGGPVWSRRPAVAAAQLVMVPGASVGWDEAEGELVALDLGDLELSAAAQPASPAPAPASVDWLLHPKGPHDVRRAMPWDGHVYPPPPGIPSPGRGEELRRRAWLWAQRRAWPWVKRQARDAAERAFWAWLEGYLAGDKVPPRPDMPRLPPGDTPSRPALPPGEPAAPVPAGDPAAAAPALGPSLDPDTLRAYLNDPVGSGAYSKEPLERLDQWLKLAGIRHFTARELCRQKWRSAGHTYKGEVRGFAGKVRKGLACWSEVLDALPPVFVGRRGLMVELPEFVVPPVEWWPRILPVLMVLDRYRHLHGKPVVSISAYRCAAYNWQIGGAIDSRHMRFEAVDFVPMGDFIRNPKTGAGNVLDTRKFEQWFNHLYRQGKDGLGRYDDFLHLDIGTRGVSKAKNWDYRSWA